MKKVVLVEFPSNLGLRETSPGNEPGVRFLPEWLKQYGLHDALNISECLRLEAPAYTHEKDKETGLLNADALVEYGVQQSALLGKLLSEEKFPFITGGDCSILLGAAMALKQKGNYGLFYLDGHTDFMDISLSETGGAGGMAASIVVGKGHKKLTDIAGLYPYIKEDNVWCVGNREYDDAYEDEIRHSNAGYISLAMLREKGMAAVANDFVAMIEQKALDGFWLHIDVDVLNDDIMPCVDSRTADGLSYAEFNELTGILFKSKELAGLEITILDPQLDVTGIYTNQFVQNISTTFNESNQ